MDFENLTAERRALINDMVETMTTSLRACTPQEAGVIVSNVMARLVYMAGGDEASDAQVEAMVASLADGARAILSAVRASAKPA